MPIKFMNRLESRWGSFDAMNEVSKDVVQQ